MVWSGSRRSASASGARSRSVGSMASARAARSARVTISAVIIRVPLASCIVACVLFEEGTPLHGRVLGSARRGRHCAQVAEGRPHARGKQLHRAKDLVRGQRTKLEDQVEDAAADLLVYGAHLGDDRLRPATEDLAERDLLIQRMVLLAGDVSLVALANRRVTLAIEA